MTAPLFLTDTETLSHDRVTLAGKEGRHAATVRRIAVGETVDLTDGEGARARCEVIEVGRDTVVFAVRDRWNEIPPEPRLTVVQALPKGDRGELAVELMTEAGVDRLVPWQAQRSIAKWQGERAAKGTAKWRATAREAAKQSRRSHLPVVEDLYRMESVVDSLRSATLALVLHEDASRRLTEVTPPTSGEVVLVVGPEGGFTDTELAAFTDAGAQRVALGTSVLRTSTAGVAALSVLQARCGRW
ncbi:16S rRNA (uracil(1498)-N(3))-methyltransferase [Spiractinospora alimapuensis]|uniref:16S rRNA (uracil(1498)-N(3))-methyltransferase n=1 Tax=Spiractinospora alimapuensis TaxID=2820884 RepID=UPI001EEA9524|nr:16S rRNA (uracil(1498)-N(3))-methyltransferase [Spiractinospora alimapuensis]QVQ53607.1 16S rRNA (uracil(1498)-N(3))-methyltransferase [Spiractinospora alimapuensis]